MSSIRSVAIVLLATLVLVTPTVAAASFELGAERIVERGLQPGTDAILPMPLTVTQAGFLYVKILPTPGNAVNDGTRTNGSVQDGTGWRVSFAVIRTDGEREELGTFVNSTPTKLIPVAAGEQIVLENVVHIPKDAGRGGPNQRVYVAVAYRAASLAGPGLASGASIDEARALTLLLTNALLPPPPLDEPDGPPIVEPTPGESPTTYPPVTPIGDARAPGGVNVTLQMPTWFLVGVLLAFFIIALAVAALVLTLATLTKTTQLALDAARAKGSDDAGRPIPVTSAATHASESGRTSSALPRTGVPETDKAFEPLSGAREGET